MFGGLGSVVEQRSPKPLTGVRFPQPPPVCMKNFTDEQLVKNHLEGDEKALEEIIKRYLPLIYNFSRRYAGDSDNASDIAQEVFVKVWKNLKNFDISRSFKAWIFSIAKNTALDWLKKRNAVPFSLLREYQKDGEFLNNIADSDQISAIDRAYKTSLVQNLSFAIEKLPPKYSAIIDLRHKKGFKFQEISALLSEPLNTVKSRYRRGVAMLKKLL